MSMLDDMRSIARLPKLIEIKRKECLSLLGTNADEYERCMKELDALENRLESLKSKTMRRHNKIVETRNNTRRSKENYAKTRNNPKRKSTWLNRLFCRGSECNANKPVSNKNVNKAMNNLRNALNKNKENRERSTRAFDGGYRRRTRKSRR